MKFLKTALPAAVAIALLCSAHTASAASRTSPLVEKCGQNVPLIFFSFFAPDKKCDDRQDAIVIRNYLHKNAAAVQLLCRSRVEAWTMERNHLSCRVGTRDSGGAFARRLRIHLAIEQERKQAMK
jgi:hypothetical protein